MSTVADTHIHIYPCYDVAELVARATANLNALAPEAEDRVLFLTERYDCHFFRECSERSGQGGIVVERCAQPEVLKLSGSDDSSLYLVAGRQIVTSERLEILALTVDADIDDGQPAGQVVRAVLELGGVPVLSWAPGKWLLKRSRFVRELIETFQPGELLLGDTTLRPTIYPEPQLMRCGRQKGLSVLAGSDPLPFVGEERWAGTYGAIWPSDVSSQHPVDSLRSMLKSTETPRLLGTRGGPLSVLSRLKKNSDAKKSG